MIDRVYFARRTLALVLTLTLVIGGCADAPSAPTDSSLRGSASFGTSAPSDAQSVAQGLAFAMRDASVRKQVHRAMQSSLLNEHKLVLQDFLNTGDGQELLSSAAAALNLTPGSLQATITNLPRLDFYAPFKAHRLTWKATSDIYVATTFDPDAPAITAYGTNGQTLTLRKDQGVPAVPLIILHPAEPKWTRDVALAASVGEAIESPAERPAANSSVGLSPSGASFNIPPGGGGGGGGGGPAPGTYINHFNIQEGDGWFGSLEIQFHSSAVVGYGGFAQGNESAPDRWFIISTDICPLGTYAQSAEEDLGYDGLFLISPSIYSGTYVTCNGQPARYTINIVEIDGGIMGDNDDYGYRLYSVGGYPLGAGYHPTVNSYYGNTFPYNQGSPATNRVAYLRIISY